MRMEPALPKLIHSDQTGFIEGRYIGQNIGLLSDLMMFTDANKFAGILLFIDFEKAFDSVELTSIFRALERFNFGPNIRRWISILYNDIESGVINGGYLTNYFKVSRGVRQGCPLSPFLFILAVEILALKIRQNTDCRGINLPNSYEAKLSQFADDTTVISRDIESLKSYLLTIENFGCICGLKLNTKQTKAMWIGSQKGNKNKILDFKCVKDPIKTLAAYLSYNQDKNNEANFLTKLER